MLITREELLRSLVEGTVDKTLDAATPAQQAVREQRGTKRGDGAFAGAYGQTTKRGLFTMGDPFQEA